MLSIFSKVTIRHYPYLNHSMIFQSVKNCWYFLLSTNYYPLSCCSTFLNYQNSILTLVALSILSCSCYAVEVPCCTNIDCPPPMNLFNVWKSYFKMAHPPPPPPPPPPPRKDMCCHLPPTWLVPYEYEYQYDMCTYVQDRHVLPPTSYMIGPIRIWIPIWHVYICSGQTCAATYLLRDWFYTGHVLPPTCYMIGPMLASSLASLACSCSISFMLWRASLAAALLAMR